MSTITATRAVGFGSLGLVGTLVARSIGLSACLAVAFLLIAALVS
jgi:hypothetical protein